MKLVHQEYPPKLVEIAKKRAAEHLYGLRMVDFDLQQAMVNCYLQAVLDLAQAQQGEAEKQSMDIV